VGFWSRRITIKNKGSKIKVRQPRGRRGAPPPIDGLNIVELNVSDKVISDGQVYQGPLSYDGRKRRWRRGR